MMLAELSFPAIWTAIGSAVLHFLWQGALIGLVTAALLRAMQSRSAAERCNVACGALFVSLGVFLFSFVQQSGRTFAPTSSGWGGAPVVETSLVEGARIELGANGLVAALWVLGVLVMGVRFLLQNRAVQRLKRHGVARVEPRWERLFAQLREELGVDRGIRLLKSTLAEVPMVVGWLNPVVLVPASAFTGLSCDQLRSLLAHELAHIRRKDHLLNAVQAVVEALLFFHPAVWWISKQVRLEREFCCDDSSVQVLGDAKLLAEALAGMEALRLNPAVLGANGGPLMQRITRILGVRQTPRTAISIWQIPAGLVFAGALALAGNAYTRTTSPLQDSRGEVSERRDQREVKEAGKVRQEARGKRKRAIKAEAQAVKARIDAAVASGKITAEQGEERFAAWKKKVAESMGVEAERETFRRELHELIATGEITEAEARAKMNAFERKLQKMEVKRFREGLRKRIDAGELSEAEAREQYARFMQRFERERMERLEADPEAFLRHIEAQVEAGKLTPEEGKQQVEAYRERRAQQQRMKREFEGMERRIRAGIESGKITAEEGKKRLEELRRQLEVREREERMRREWSTSLEDVERKLKAEVEAGRLTAEEARLKLDAMKRRLIEEKKSKKLKRDTPPAQEKSGKE